MVPPTSSLKASQVSSYLFPYAVSEGQYLMELAASLFGYAGEQGDHNALYTYAQLLRTGTTLPPPLLHSSTLYLPQGKVWKWT